MTTGEQDKMNLPRLGKSPPTEEVVEKHNKALKHIIKLWQDALQYPVDASVYDRHREVMLKVCKDFGIEDPNV